MRVDIRFPNGHVEQTAIAEDGEFTEVSSGSVVILRVKRIGENHVEAILWPAEAEERPAKRLRVVT